MKLFRALLPRLTQRSTIIGVIGGVAIVSGHALAPDTASVVADVVSSIASLALILVNEQPPPGGPMPG